MPVTKTPLYGASGFGQPYNLYTWQMAIWDNRLWVGMYDWGYIAALSSEVTTTKGTRLPGIAKVPGAPTISNYGGDLVSFANSQSPAVIESVTGLGNYSNIGVRRLAPAADALWVGMANPMNLLTDTTDTLPEGGWELIKLTKKNQAKSQK